MQKIVDNQCVKTAHKTNCDKYQYLKYSVNLFKKINFYNIII